MAEFVEVAKHRKRMCDMLTSCAECALNIENDGDGCTGLMLDNPMEYERIMLKWAAEHPEPVYPTWEQWHKKSFPNHGSINIVLPCLFMPRVRECGSISCRECRKKRIPADIAKKLGIKPGEEWEEC